MGFLLLISKKILMESPTSTEINVRMVAFNYMFAAAGANFSSDIVKIVIT